MGTAFVVLATSLAAPLLQRGAYPAPRAMLSRAHVRLDALKDAQSALASLFSRPSEPPAPEIPPVVISEDYTLAVAFLAGGVLATGTGSAVGGVLGAVPGVIVILLGVLFTVQTGRIRFVFDDTAFELKTSARALPSCVRQPGARAPLRMASRWLRPARPWVPSK